MPAGEQSERGRNVKQKGCQSHRCSLAERAMSTRSGCCKPPPGPAPATLAARCSQALAAAGLGSAGLQGSKHPKCPRRASQGALVALPLLPGAGSPAAVPLVRAAALQEAGNPSQGSRHQGGGGTALRRCIMHVARLRSCPAWRRPTQQAGACQEGRSRACSF